MTQKMSLIHGLCIALAFTIATPFVLGIALMLVPSVAVARLIIGAGVVAYCLAIAPASTRRSGRIFTVVVISAIELSLIISSSHLLHFLLASSVVVWLSRVLLLASSVGDAIIDGGVVIMGFIAASCARSVTNGMAFPVWTFLVFLAAAPSLIACMRTLINWRTPLTRAQTLSKFEQAHRSAEGAICALARRKRCDG